MTTTSHTIRPEFTFERFNQGFKLCQAILAMWEKHERTNPSNDTINANCEAIISEFGLTYEEWHYWCRQASEVRR